MTHRNRAQTLSALFFVLVCPLAGLGACGGRVTDDATSRPTSCTRTSDGAELALTAPGGARYACDSLPETGAPLDVNATIVSTSAESFEVDTCPPNADCAGTIATITVKAPGLDLPRALPVGTQVRVRLTIGRFFACQRALNVTTLESWGGLKNPFGAGGVLLLDVIDGGAPAADAPFAFDIQALGCVGPTTSCGGRTPDDYAFSFTPKTPGGAPVMVHMGETRALSLGGDVPGTWAVRNLRSFQTEACDDYWNWSYWLAYQSPAK